MIIIDIKDIGDFIKINGEYFRISSIEHFYISSINHYASGSYGEERYELVLKITLGGKERIFNSNYMIYASDKSEDKYEKRRQRDDEEKNIRNIFELYINKNKQRHKDNPGEIL